MPVSNQSKIGTIVSVYDNPYQASKYGYNLQKWIPDHQLTLTHSLDTEITCRVCRGMCTVITNTFGTLRLRRTTCPNCNGTGKQKAFSKDESKVSRK